MHRLLIPLLLGLMACKDDSPSPDDSSGGDDSVVTDLDGDGFPASEDCDDTDDDVNPGEVEVCDGVDNNCDGAVDEGVLTTYYEDLDQDGFGKDSRAEEACQPPEGYSIVGNDCDDDDPSAYPAATEVCDGVDNDCDGEADEGVGARWYADSDGDGYGDPTTTVAACEAPTGFIAEGGDCDDGDAEINPEAVEVCDGEDNDCDGATDDEDDGLDTSTARAFNHDRDGDGYGSATDTVLACEQPAGTLVDARDCDDGDAGVNPAATEICDGVDNDCDALVDDDDGDRDASNGVTLYRDRDGDGYGEASTTTRACASATGYVADSADCDDGDAQVNPAATEVCDGQDNDCDNLVDDDDGSLDASTTSAWYDDDDRDGYGDAGALTRACDQPSGAVADSSDCDDGDAGVNPGAAEVCDNADNDCDNLIDDDDASLDASTASTWYDDDDRDGFGDPSSSTRACDQPSGAVADSSDCDDGDASVRPTATEVCDNLDNDCDSLIDDDDPGLNTATASAWYDDDDRDGYGDASALTRACDQPSGAVANATDCDDGDAGVNPGEAEICDGVDNDCDNLADDDDPGLDTSTASTWYDDADSDGYGDASSPDLACTPASGYVADDSDCDDADASIYPGAAELCFDGVDNDCDSTADEGCTTCGDGVLDSGEEYDPAPGPFTTATVDSNTCRWDFSGVNQLYCNGSCTWTGASGCQQSEADLLCQLILDDPNAYATSYTNTTALPEHGFTCPRSQYGTLINTDRGFSGNVYYTDTNILSTHGAGSIVAYPVCAR